MSETVNVEVRQPIVRIVDGRFEGKRFLVDELKAEIGNLEDPQEKYDMDILDLLGYKVIPDGL